MSDTHTHIAHRMNALHDLLTGNSGQDAWGERYQRPAPIVLILFGIVIAR